VSRSRYEAQIRKVLGERPHETAIDADGAPFTWAEARAVAAGVERTLDEARLAESERVGLMGRNRPAHFAALWGVFVSGRCASMVHAFQPPEALASDLTANRWPVVIGERRDWTAEVVAAADAAGTVGLAFTADADEPLERVTRQAKPGARADRRSDDATVLHLLSSGTTGKPKRISLARTSVDDMIERTIGLFEMAGPAASTTLIMPWPLASIGGANAALPAVALGQRLAIQEKFHAPTMLELIRRYRPAFLGIPPSALGMLLQLEPSREDLSCVKMVAAGSAPLDPAVHRRLEEEYDLPVVVSYGATEFCGIITGWPSPDRALLAAKRGSAGRALPGMQIRIVSSETGEPLPAGQTGLVEALVPRVGPDWTRTNDLAHMDEDGFLFLHGRADDAILRGGFKVVPDEVAEVLRTHPKVGDAALIGIPDERVGMVPAAVVERRAGAPAPTPQELEAFLRTKLPAYKIPARFAIVDAIPRTQSMKPRREGLRALFG
jgi:acyl-CoA synthetase (AMP-forming)/AMP-acid ligase II